MVALQKQTGIVVAEKQAGQDIPLTVNEDLDIPELPSPFHVLVRVLAVALNPTDFKMVQHFSKPGDTVGCDFVGVVVDRQHTSGAPLAVPAGTRVCGGTFPYNPKDPSNGSFAEYVTSDSRVLLKVPEQWDDLEAAALSGCGWGTAGLAFYDPEALALKGRPGHPIEQPQPVLVYGGATATGTMAIQMLKLANYLPIAVASPRSAPLAAEFGAAATIFNTSATCVDEIKKAAGSPIRLCLDCITTAESVETCFAAMARTGGRYACLEGLQESWLTRPSVKTKVIMGFEGLGVAIDLGDSEYSRKANPELLEVTIRCTEDIQQVLDAGKLKPHPIREVPGKWQGVIDGLGILHRGEQRGQKLVVRIANQ